MPNIVLSILGKDSSSGSTKSAASGLEQLAAKREAAARALVAANQREADSAGKARVAELQLAEARQKYGAESSQVARAEERLAATQRGTVSAADTVAFATARAAAAHRRLADAEESAASTAVTSSRRTRTAFEGIGNAAEATGRRGGNALLDLARNAGNLAGGIAKNAVGVAAGFAVYDIGARATGAAIDAAKNAVIDFNVQLQNADIAFTTMLGSGEKSKAFLDDLQTFARETPFEFPDLVTGSQRLLAMGVRAKDVIPYLTGIGDAAAASGKGAAAVDQITTAIGQMTAKGKVQGDEVMQLTEAGIPALKILADSYGVTTGEISKMISKGQVLSDRAVPALINGLEKGTKSTAGFGGMMAKQSKTLDGAMSNIRDSINQTTSKAFLPLFNGLSKVAGGVAKFAGSKGVQKWAQDTSKSMEDLSHEVGEGLNSVFKDPAVQKAASSLFKSIQKGLKEAKPYLKDVVPDLAEFAREVLPRLLKEAGKVAKEIPQMAKALGGLPKLLVKVGPLIGDVAGFFADLTGAVSDASNTFGPFTLSATKNLKAFFDDSKSRLDGVVGFFRDLPGNIGGTFANASTWLVSAGGDIIAGLVNGITSAGPNALGAIGQMARDLISTFRLGIDSHSPSKVFEELGRFITQGLAVGIATGSKDDVSSVMTDLVDQVKGSFQNVSDQVREARGTIKDSDSKLDRLDDSAARLGRQKHAAEQRLAAAKTDRQKTAAENSLKDIEARRQQVIRDRREAREDIADAQAIIRKDRSVKARQAAEKRANTAIAAATKELKVLAADRDAAAADLEAAQSRLDDAISLRDSYRDDVSNSVLGLGNIAAAFGGSRDSRDQARTDLIDLKSQLDELDRGAKDFDSSRAKILKSMSETDVADTLDGLRDDLSGLDDQVSEYQRNRAALATQIASTQNTADQNPVAVMVENVRQQAESAEQFQTIVADLKAKGLDDTSYKQLVDDFASGGGIGVAQGLQSAGTNTIQSLAGLQGRLKSASSALGLSTSNSLYQAGVDSAQGFVDGLQSKIADLTKTMTGIADAMVKTIKTQLGIKSPSTVFRTQGLYVTQGLIQGLTLGKSEVAAAVAGLVPTDVSTPHLAGATTSGRGRGGGFSVAGDLNITVPSGGPAEIIAALDWAARTQI